MNNDENKKIIIDEDILIKKSKSVNKNGNKKRKPASNDTSSKNNSYKNSVNKKYPKDNKETKTTKTTKNRVVNKVKKRKKLKLNVKKEEFKVIITPTFVVPSIKKRKKRRLRKEVIMILFLIVAIVIAVFVYRGIEAYKEQQAQIKEEKRRSELVKKIESHYSNYVVVDKDSNLYRFDEESNDYYQYGVIYKNTELSLEELTIDYNTKYFYSSDLEAYVAYENLKPISELRVYSDRYKNYIVFNENVVTKEEFTLYDDQDEKVYSFNKSMSFPIIIKNYDNKYYVEFNNRLLYVVKEDIESFEKANNTSSKNASKITALCYHRVYDTDEKCNDIYICKKKSAFDKEMSYLKSNNYFTLTMEETYLYLSKKIQIPRKSVVITLDDGHLIASAIEVFEKYQLNATSFIKTKSFSDLSSFTSNYLEVHSHTHNMHTAGVCQRETSYQQGGGILCLSREKVLEDLRTSREFLNGAIALAYPFYDYNQRAIELVKEAGFKIAFIGSNSVGGRSYPGINLYKVPRMTMWDTTSFETFKGYVTN